MLSCALCSGTLIRRNVPPAHSQHFRVAVDVEKYIRYIDKSLASELKHFLLPQSSGRSWLKEIFLFSQFSEQLHERHCSSIFTGHIQSIHCMLPARPRCEECAVIATPAPRHRRYTLYGGSGGQRAGPWGVRTPSRYQSLKRRLNEGSQRLAVS